MGGVLTNRVPFRDGFLVLVLDHAERADEDTGVTGTVGKTSDIAVFNSSADGLGREVREALLIRLYANRLT